MSRAFTKEIDDAPPPPRPERPVSDAPNLVTPRGAELIDARLAEIDDALARGLGPADELSREQRYWSIRHASMQIVPPVENPEAVSFGTRVDMLRRGRKITITIVGEDEADPTRGLIAWTSPLARALDGMEAGDEIAFEAGGHDETIEILAISAA